MNIDEAKFKILEQNIQSLTQAVYQLVYSLSDLKLLLARDKILVHPEEKSDIPPHSLFAQTKRFLEKEGFEFAEETSDTPNRSLFAQVKRSLDKDGFAALKDVVHTEPVETCKACERNRKQVANPLVAKSPLVCLGSTTCDCSNCHNKRRSQSCTGDYYGVL